MSRAAVDSLQILVHATAPARGADDARYRALASAYVEFQPARRINLQERDDIKHGETDKRLVVESTVGLRSGDTKDVPSSISSGQADSNSTSQAWYVPTSPEPMTRSYIQQSFSPISSSSSKEAGHCDENRSRHVSEHAPAPVDLQQNSWHTPPSVVEDSQPIQGRLLTDFASPGQALEVFLQHCDSRLPISSTSPGLSVVCSLHVKGVDLGIAPKPNKVLVAETPAKQTKDLADEIDVTGTEERTSEIKVTTSSFIVPDTAKAIERQRNRVPAGSGNSSLLHNNECVYSTTLSNTGQASDTPCRPGNEAPRKTLSTSAASAKVVHVSRTPNQTYRGTSESESSIAIPSSDLRQPSSSPGSVRARHPLPIPPTPTQSGKRRKLRHAEDPNCIFAPIPKPSRIPSLTTAMLTPSPLLKLFGQVKPNRRYKPIRCVRDVRPLERGCWVFSTATWADELRRSTWAFLTTFIGEGRAGWGVWCTRDANPEQTTDGDHLLAEHGLVCWKVFCWGQVVEHIWQLLYTASNRTLRNGGAKWIDADGEAVIVMP